MQCGLCTAAVTESTARRLAGLSVCDACGLSAPTDALGDQGIGAEFQWRMMRFLASLHIPGVPAGVSFSARPERWMTAVAKLWVAELEVGDDVFDRQIYLRTAGDAAEPLLGEEGVQSALLSLLTGTKPELVPNHVTLDGPQLSISVRPLERMGEDGYLERQLMAAALAVHVKRHFAS